jgi:hypothetical protein
MNVVVAIRTGGARVSENRSSLPGHLTESETARFLCEER